MKKSDYLGKIQLAAEHLFKATAGKKPEFIHVARHDGDILSAAKTHGLDDATGTPCQCAISHAIVSAAYHNDKPLQVVADAEAAWEHQQWLAQMKASTRAA